MMTQPCDADLNQRFRWQFRSSGRAIVRLTHEPILTNLFLLLMFCIDRIYRTYDVPLGSS
jgi:hypothetical protein